MAPHRLLLLALIFFMQFIIKSIILKLCLDIYSSYKCEINSVVFLQLPVSYARCRHKINLVNTRFRYAGELLPSKGGAKLAITSLSDVTSLGIIENQ